MTAETRRIMIVESAISIIPNSLGGGLITWLLFRGVDPIPLWGLEGVAFDLLPTTFLVTLLSTVILTLVIRKRVQTGAARQAAPGGIALHRNAFVRSGIFACIMSVLFVPLTVLIITQFWGQGWSLAGVVFFKIIYCILLGLIVTPVAVLVALQDHLPKKNFGSRR